MTYRAEDKWFWWQGIVSWNTFPRLDDRFYILKWMALLSPSWENPAALQINHGKILQRLRLNRLELYTYKVCALQHTCNSIFLNNQLKIIPKWFWWSAHSGANNVTVFEYTTKCSTGEFFQSFHIFQDQISLLDNMVWSFGAWKLSKSIFHIHSEKNCCLPHNHLSHEVVVLVSLFLPPSTPLPQPWL